MTEIHIVVLISGWLQFLLICGLMLLFLFTTIREKKWLALWRGFVLFFIPAGSLFILLLSQHYFLIAIFSALAIISIIILSFPFHKISSLKVVAGPKRIDERDAIFHRFYKLTPNTPDFNRFYDQHPELIEIDNTIRQLPQLATPGSRGYHPLVSPYQEAIFNVLEDITRDIEWTAKPEKTEQLPREPSEMTNRIKGFARYLGADLVGITKLNPAHIYSHIGRSPGKWGAEIKLEHQYAIAIAVEMASEMIDQSPRIATTTETAFKYFEAAKIALILTKYINMLGYDARAHVDGNYRVLCVPVAADAGLGELSRMGLLITPEYGPRVRLAVVTTTLKLETDEHTAFGVQHFCSICKKCARQCPSGAINGGEKSIVNGVEKWQSNQESCYRFWRLQGSDCAICVKVCPYSYPGTGFHNLIRWLIKRNNLSRRFSLTGDQLVYGNNRKIAATLPAWHDTSQLTFS